MDRFQVVLGMEAASARLISSFQGFRPRRKLRTVLPDAVNERYIGKLNLPALIGLHQQGQCLDRPLPHEFVALADTGKSPAVRVVVQRGDSDILRDPESSRFEKLGHAAPVAEHAVDAVALYPRPKHLFDASLLVSPKQQGWHHRDTAVFVDLYKIACAERFSERRLLYRTDGEAYPPVTEFGHASYCRPRDCGLIIAHGVQGQPQVLGFNTESAEIIPIHIERLQAVVQRGHDHPAYAAGSEDSGKSQAL
jgi:hypothetical protein